MSTPTSTSPLRECPSCGYPIPPGRRSLCPNCRHPLIFDAEDDTVGAVAATGLHKPTEVPAPDETVVMSAVPASPPSTQPEAGPVCPSCGHVNAPSRLRCERCASTLASRPLPPPLPPPPATPPRRPTGLLVGAVAGALILALGLGFLAFWMSRPDGGDASVGRPGVGLPSPTPTLTSRPSTPAELTRVKHKAIKAKASSTLASGEFTYGIDNTLDGDPTTAWNSDGDRVGAFARVTLTYRFSKPVELRAIEVYNGYQRSTEAFENNSRVRSLLVSTDATKQTFELVDRQGAQTLAYDFGKTKRVVLTVDAVFRDTPRKTRYKDCAVSEVRFYRTP